MINKNKKNRGQLNSPTVQRKKYTNIIIPQNQENARGK